MPCERAHSERGAKQRLDNHPFDCGFKVSRYGALTAMVINKTSGGLTSTVSLTGFSAAGSAQAWRYSSGNLGAIEHAPDLALAGSSLSATFPARSRCRVLGARPVASLLCHFAVTVLLRLFPCRRLQA